MTRILLRHTLSIGCLLLIAFGADGQTVVAHGLTCNYTVNPMAVDDPAPRLSWMMTDPRRGASQSAYQILVASSPEQLNEKGADLWNSGKVSSNQSGNIHYKGKALVSRARCYWKVRIWDHDGQPGVWSETAVWEMGLLDPKDWPGKWISAAASHDSIPPLQPAPFFRKRFSLRSAVQSARLYVSGIGYCEVYLNDKRVGDHVLDPAVTRYDRRVKYVTYDVTPLLLPKAPNAVGFILGNGWYNQHSKTAWDFDQAPWRSAPAVKAQLEITYRDGTRDIVATGDDWKFAFGPITFNDVHNGEHYDARLELGHWSSGQYEDGPWSKPYVVKGPPGRLSSQQLPPIRVTQHLAVKRQWRFGDKLIYDFGQNMSGRIRLTVKGPAGAEVKMQHGERVTAEGDLDMNELSRFIRTGEVQTDRYTLRGTGEETWHPVFTYHGFQYVAVETNPDVEVISVTAEVVHTDFASGGTFTCSDTLFNRLYENLCWSYRTNFHSYPTDCPHREKMGWSGDAQLMVETGLFAFDASTAYLKWLDDFADEQRPNGQFPGIIPSSGWGYTFAQGEKRERGYGPQWEGAFVTILWQLYLYKGDTAILKKYYDVAQKYIDYLTAQSDDFLIAFGIDDHKQLSPVTQGDILSAGYYYHLTAILARMARVLGKFNDASIYRVAAHRTRASFNEKYFHPETGIYGKGGQTQLSEALYMDLVEPSYREIVKDNLLKAISDRYGHVETGVLGTKFMLNALMDEHEDRVLYNMCHTDEFPGWGYWVKNGATTMFQNWDMSQSRNHIMFGTIGDYFYKGLAGFRLRDESPGFRHFVVDPSLENDVLNVSASLNSPKGIVVVDWRKGKEQFDIRIVVPPNASAEVKLPASSAGQIQESDQALDQASGIRSFSKVGNRTSVEIGSGTYTFTVHSPTY